MATAEADVAAKLIERLLVDPAFRARFRRNPAAACREAGLESLAQEMQIGAGKAMMTLDLRESKSSLAGVMMAAAMEGVGVMQFAEHIAPHLDDIPEAVGDVLSRINLPAIGLPGGGGGGKSSAPVPPPKEDAAGDVAGNGAAAAAAPAAAPEQAAAVAPEAAPAADAAGGASPEEAAAEDPKAAGKAAAAEIKAAESPEAQTAKKAQEAAAEIAEDAEDLPSATDLPSGNVEPQASVDVGADPNAAPAAPAPEQAAPAPAPAVSPEQAAATPVAPAPAPAPAEPAPTPPAVASAPVDVAGGTSRAPDPSEYGQDGTGGEPTPEMLAILKNKNITFDATGIADIKAGKIDPRVIAAMTKLSEDHKITVTCMCSDHSKFTSGGSISNHAHGRGLDIGTIDGEIVRPNSAAGRALATELAELPEEYRPNEIGSPWPIAGPGYFTDGAHQDHIHFGFKQAITKDWTPPADVAAGGSAGAAAAASAVPGAVAVPGAPAVAAAAAVPGAPAGAVAAAAPVAPKPGDSGQFMAAEATAAGVGKGDSGQFMAAQAPAGPASAIAPPAAVPDAVAAAAAVPAPGGSALGASALKVAESQLGVHEAGVNTGAEVDKYLAAAGVSPGNPWCASFVAWSLEQSGHKMDGSGWAAVQTWVRNAEQGNNNLQIVSADEARPGDIVAYDWGGQDDFGADGHIGFLASGVQGDKFTALEGNNQDQVMRVPRQTSGANVKFIRINGDAPAGGVAAAPPAAVESAAAPAAGAPADVAVGSRRAPDPSEFGLDGKGGEPTPEMLAILKNENITFDATGIADIKAGKIDPRVIATLTKLSEDHKLTVTCMCSDHSRSTAGGSISNHSLGRGLDIGTVDGEIVGPGSAASRELASELSQLDQNYRPDEIGSPWPISGPGYFTDAAHQNHLHLGFKTEIPKDWATPADVAVGGAAAPAAVASAVPGAPAVAAAAPVAPKPGDSGQFMAAKATTAGAAKGDSGQFMAAPGAPAEAQAAAAPAAPGVADAAAGAVDLSGVGGYPGDNAPKEQLAAWLGREAEKRGLPPELPVMASLVESGVKNLNFGDADSVGFFQMRVGIWNQGAYEGFPEKPELQAKWFLDTAEQVKKQRIARGQSIDDPSSYGDWIADVERPAEQYRGRYQLRLEEAKGLLAKGAGAPVAPAIDPAAATPAPAAPAAAAEPAGVAADAAGAAAGAAAGPKAMAALVEAQKYTGTDYKWGGSTPQTGFDCSGLVQWAYAKAGVQIPRVTDAQFAAGNTTSVERGELKPGDLVFFGKPGNIYHVGISMGGDKFLHAPKTGDVVKVSELGESYYSENFAGGRRFDDAAGAVAAPAAPAAAAAVAAPATPATPAIDPEAVARAQAALARDAAEVNRKDSGLFMAVEAQESRKRHATVQFMKAINPEEASTAAAASAPVAAAAAPAVAPVDPAAPAAAPASGATALDGVPEGPDDYPGNNASKDQLAKWLAKQAEKAGLPPELPVMASLVESGVKNINYGDADSVGFFQMRVGIWNQGDYAGYPENPELQAKWFIDQALAVKKKAIAGGNADFGNDPNSWGEWIADIERPAEQYRGRYQLRLNEAQTLLKS